VEFGLRRVPVEEAVKVVGARASAVQGFRALAEKLTRSADHVLTTIDSLSSLLAQMSASACSWTASTAESRAARREQLAALELEAQARGPHLQRELPAASWRAPFDELK